jgi:hypothetical protein
VLILPMLLGAFQPLKPAPGGPTTVFPWGREQELLALCSICNAHPGLASSIRHVKSAREAHDWIVRVNVIYILRRQELVLG